MKRAAYITMAAVAVVLMSLVPAYAQKASATVNIPFTFTVDDVRMPAGQYIITEPSEKVIEIQHLGGHEANISVETRPRRLSPTKALPPTGPAIRAWSSIAMATPTFWPPFGCPAPTTLASSSPRPTKSKSPATADRM